MKNNKFITIYVISLISIVLYFYFNIEIPQYK